ncbi:MAG: RDD family protein [Acidimicrobiales bacterium]
MSQRPPDGPSGPPPYPGQAPPPYPGSAPPSAPPRDDWYTAPGRQQGAYYPPGTTPPGQWGGQPGYGAAQAGFAGAPYAGWWVRVAGTIIDGILISLVSSIYLVPSHAFRSMHSTTNGIDHARFAVDTRGLIVIIVVSALYSGLMIGLRGQTLGMMAVRVRAVDAQTGGTIGLWRAVGRDLLERVLGFLLFIPLVIDLLYPLWDPRHQTLHDKATNTVVIRT